MLTLGFGDIFKSIGILLLTLITLLIISLKPVSIEWDKYDSSLHGKKVIFKNKMVYVLLGEEHMNRNYGYTREEIKIGKILVESGSSFFHSLAYANEKTSYVMVTNEMVFTIEKTYWQRHNWLMKSFSGDIRYALLKDSNGTLSTSPFFNFYESSTPELAELGLF